MGGDVGANQPPLAQMFDGGPDQIGPVPPRAAAGEVDAANEKIDRLAHDKIQSHDAEPESPTNPAPMVSYFPKRQPAENGEDGEDGTAGPAGEHDEPRSSQANQGQHAVLPP